MPRTSMTVAFSMPNPPQQPSDPGCRDTYAGVWREEVEGGEGASEPEDKGQERGWEEEGWDRGEQEGRKEGGILKHC